LAVLIVGLMASIAPAAEPAAKPADETGTRIYDTGAPSKEVDFSESGRKDWVLLPEENLEREFKGSAVLVNEFVMVILNPQWAVADACAKTDKGWISRASFCALPAKGPKQGGNWAFKTVENTRAAVALRAACPTADGKHVEFVCRLTTGLPAVELRPGEGTEGMRVSSVVCWTVVPDYFGDDFERALVPDSSVRIPAENMVLGRQSPGGCMLMTVWRPDPGGAGSIKLSSKGVTSTWEVPGAANRPVWLALLESAPWDWCLLRSKSGEPLKEQWPWKPPFPARWRADFFAKDGRCRSETTESSSAPPAAPEGFDNGRLTYVLDRSRATPLDVFTPMDIMRNTLGVGPCQYVLDAEGLSGGEAATPAFVMDWVEKQLKKKKVDADEVRERLKSMTEHVGRTHARIKKYADFAEEVNVLLAAGLPGGTPIDRTPEKEKLWATVADLKASAATGLAATEADKVAKPADEIAGLVGKEDAAAKAAGPVAEVRAVGAAEDRALAKCRMATRWLRCQCLDIAESDLAKKAPALAEVAKKIEARAAEMLQAK
jgi:hypothetical protein